MPGANKKQIRTGPEIIQPLTISLLLIMVYRAGVFIPIPFLNQEGIRESIDTYWQVPWQGEYSIFMLGIMPYVSAYLIIEIGSLFVPILKRFRQKGFAGRHMLKRSALVLSLFLAIPHAFSIISSFESMGYPNGLPVLEIHSNIEYLLLICILVGSFYLLVGLCELISKFGIGNGISLLMLSGMFADLIGHRQFYLRQFERFGLVSVLIVTLFICAVSYYGFVLLTTRKSIPCYHEKNETVVDYFQLNLCPSSKVALEYSASLIMIPFTICQFSGCPKGLIEKFNPGSIGYSVAMVLLILIISFLLGWAFFHPRRRLERLRAWGWRLSENSVPVESCLRKKLFACNLPWSAFLCVIAIFPSAIIMVVDGPFYIHGGSILLAVAICVDLIGYFNFSRTNQKRPVKIAEFHDIYDADMIKNHLKAQGIESYSQGYHHRLLLYFLGPFIEISLFVNPQEKDAALALIRTYYGGAGLIG